VNGQSPLSSDSCSNTFVPERLSAEVVGPSPPPPDHARAQQTSGPSREPPSRKDRPAATPADERETVVVVGMQGPTLPLKGPETQSEQALRLYAKGMEQIARGNVSAARMFSMRAAMSGSTRSMRALAGTYDLVQLDKLKVLGMQSDVDVARKLYEKADDLDAPKTTEPIVREENSSAVAMDKPAMDLTQFRVAYLSGDGLSYVIIKDEKGEHLYRYGDISRSAAKDNTQAYRIYACNTPHIFTREKPIERNRREAW
jgi:hypothetical protein